MARRPVRLGGVAVMVAVVTGAAACGAGGGGVVDAGPGPTRAPGAGGPSAAPPQTAPAVGQLGATTRVSLWFTRGDALQAVTRSVPKVTGIGAEAVKALLAGPTPEDTRAGLGTAIPPGTRFLGLTIGNGVARVDLSRQFEAPTDGGQALRLAQVTCTLDQFDSVQGVRFSIDGELVGVLSGGGAVVDEPVTCADYRRLLAAK